MQYQLIVMVLAKYRIAQKFRGSKFSQIAVFENFVEIISRIHCLKHAMPTLFIELSFIDLAAAVNTRNLEGTFLSYSPSLHQLAEVKQLQYLPQIRHESAP